MNAHSPDPLLVTGRLDTELRLAEADPRLAALNARAGGAVGMPLAIPQVAALARLAHRLGILVSRNVLAADGEEDVDLWVRAEPDDGGVRLAITGWRTRGGWAGANEPGSAGDFARAGADWLFETDAALRLTMVSPEAGARYGFDAGAVLGQPVTRLFVLREGSDGGLPILGAVAAQERFDHQHATLRDSGREVRLAATPRLDGQGRFGGLAGAVTVLGEQTAAAAPAPTGLPEAFAERLDHALRRPLGRIIANADSIHAQTEGPLLADYVSYAGDIADAGRHLLGLVDDLVDLQAIERDDFTVAGESLDLADVARRAGGLLALRAAQADVRLERPPPGETMPATGEFRRALQILVNLIGNAIRHSPPGGMIWLRIERDGDTAAVIVADQGKGIAAANHARIFEKFERVAGEPSGSGLGLYIARRLARAMGGDVTVDSAPGQGARFVLTLPAG